MEPSHHFTAAEGYADLGMIRRARECLAELSPAERALPRVIRLRVRLHLAAREWQEGWAACRHLLDLAPEDPSAHIHGAYCLHEMGLTDEARDLLLSGPESLRREPVFFYNLGCYEARLGELESARAWLLRSFEMDEALLRQARRDPDITDIWEDLRRCLEEA